MNKIMRRSMISVSIGLAVLLGILIYGMFVKYQQGSQIQTYYTQVKEKPNEINGEIEKALKYNQIVKDLQAGIASESLKEYNNIFPKNNGLIGVVSVPKINLRLPVFHGVEDEILMKGVGHVSDTAFPIGNGASVITGHNGVPGADMLFTRIDELNKGDLVEMQIGTYKYVYKVNEIETFTPDGAEDYVRQLTGDKLTLMTCTPYGINSHRLMVTGDFIKREIMKEEDEKRPAIITFGIETVITLFLLFVGFSALIYMILKVRQDGWEKS